MAIKSSSLLSLILPNFLSWSLLSNLSIYSFPYFLDCEDDEIACPETKKCIPVHWLCDEYTDCDNDWDEINCSESLFHSNTLKKMRVNPEAKHWILY